MTIRSTAVLGAGTMGAQIAAHLANAGFPVVLLDLTADVAREGLKRASMLKPDPFFTRDAAQLIAVGGFDRDLGRLSSADWIIEAVVERLEVKRALFDRVETTRRPGSIVSSNTSGIPIAALAEGRTEDFRRHFLGTHFFNPPRYLRLVEVIPHEETRSEVVSEVAHFADHRLGKGVVIAKDSPSFIANRIGLYGVIQALRALESGDYTIEEIDAITGPALGRPRSATCRTMDIAGIDVFGHVVRDLRERAPDAETAEAFVLPPIVQGLIERGWFGEKTGQGFYKRVGSDILTLDPQSFTYRPQQPVRLAALEATRTIEQVSERVKTLFDGSDKVGAFLRTTLVPTLVYTARVAPAVAQTIDDIDRAMRWGFGWELGPFELWDAIGIRKVVDASAASAPPPSPLVAEALAEHRDRFRPGALPPAGPGLEILRAAKTGTTVVQRNPGASLVDLGDGVLAVEFHSKMNSLGEDAVQMILAGLARTASGYAALVVGNDAPDFSAGANLTLLLLAAQDGRWDDIDAMVRGFQGMTRALRYADVPVVVAPAGRTLGGGCEIALHADRVQAAAESYLGLVEVGVGLIPAGGGTKEMVARAGRLAGGHLDAAAVQSAFENIALAKVSTNAAHARQLGYLRDCDGMTMNRERLMADAKAVARARSGDSYQRPRPEAIPVGGETTEASLKLGVHLAWRAGRISDHDALIGRSLAHVMSGGSLAHATTVSEEYLLDLEREAFLKLCGEPKTQERILHTLKSGKPLRN